MVRAASENDKPGRNETAQPTDAADEEHRRRLADGRACLAAALEYLRLGWSPLALCPPDHVGIRRVSRNHSDGCKSPGKRPWHGWKELQERRATEAEVRDWWRRMPNSNVGVALGPVSGLVRVDVDGPAGEARLLELSGGDLPPTLEFVGDAAKGGRGLLYSIPDGATLRTTNETPRPGEELRFQARGAQTVLPPSRHPKGTVYTWRPGHGPADMRPALMPVWLVRAMAPTGRGAPLAPDGDADLLLAADAEPPADKLKLLLECSKAAREAFERKHVQPDMSASGQDMTLANVAAAAGWAEQEITDLLLHCRASNGEDQLLRSPSYYQLTVGKARARAAESAGGDDRHKGNGQGDASQAAGAPKPGPPAFSLGPFTLRPGPARRTPAGVVKTPVAVLKAGAVAADFVLSSTQTSWKGPARTVEQLLTEEGVATEADKADIEKIFRRIVADASVRADAPPAAVEGATVEAIVREKVPAMWQLKCRTDKGAWSEEKPGEVSRGEFTSYVPDDLMDACGGAVDAPRLANGLPARQDLLRQIQTELLVAWSSILRTLPPLPDARLGESTAAGRQFRSAMVRLWTTPGTWVIPLEKADSPGERVGATKASLVSRMLCQQREWGRAGEGVAAREAWRKIHPALSAWWRVAEVGGEVLVFLAMRWDLANAVKQTLPGVADQPSLNALGKQFGVTDPAPPVSANLSGGKARLAVLSRDLTDELLAVPDENATDDETYAERAEEGAETQ